jgi:hypothetical protein
MNSKIPLLGRKYLSLTIAVCFIFIYLIFTEVYDRYSNTWSLYQALREKQSTVLDPVLLEHRRRVLTAERDSLSSRILKDRSAYQQNEIGVIQCVADDARRSQVMIGSFNPGDEHVSGQFEEFDFGVSVKGRFSQIGILINGLETETIPFDITKVQMISSPIGESNLQVNIQAKAYLYHGVH